MFLSHVRRVAWGWLVGWLAPCEPCKPATECCITFQTYRNPEPLVWTRPPSGGHTSVIHTCATRRRSPVTRRATACAPRIIPDRGITRAFSIYRRLSPDSRTPRYRRAIAISASLRFPRNFGGKRIDLVSLYSVNN